MQTSPLAPGVSPVEIHYRDEGEGVPLVLLHGGWGLHSQSLQSPTRNAERRIQSGLSRSFGLWQAQQSWLKVSLRDFHYRAATETLNLLDALGIERAFFWGHSDGAVIAAIIGFTAPERVRGLILEAFHYYRLKPSSREFFETLASDPEALGAELCGKFALEFGVDHWRRLITQPREDVEGNSAH